MNFQFGQSAVCPVNGSGFAKDLMSTNFATQSGTCCTGGGTASGLSAVMTAAVMSS